MYVPGSHARMPSVMLSTFSMEAAGGRHMSSITAATSGTWSLANRIVYVAFTLNRAVTVYKLWWLNGSTVGTNNLQVAVYNSAFGRVINGTSTLSANANVCQFDDITDTGLPAGRYYMALWCSGTTATVFRSGASVTTPGIYYEANGSGPQATGTPAAPGTQSPVIPVFGLQLRSSP